MCLNLPTGLILSCLPSETADRLGTLVHYLLLEPPRIRYRGRAPVRFDVRLCWFRHALGRLRGAMSPSNPTADDVQALAGDWGANVMRYQIREVLGQG